MPSIDSARQKVKDLARAIEELGPPPPGVDIDLDIVTPEPQEEEDEDDDVANGSPVSSMGRETIDLTDDSPSDDPDLHRREARDDTDMGYGPRAIRHSQLSNHTIRDPHKIPQYSINGMVIRPDILVEVQSRGKTEFSWQFLLVDSLYQYRENGAGVILWGLRYTRNRSMGHALPKQGNEICALYKVCEDDKRDRHTQSLTSIGVGEVLRVRELRRTNALFPDHRVPRSTYGSVAQAEIQGVLVQRWEYTTTYRSTAAMQLALAANLNKELQASQRGMVYKRADSHGCLRLLRANEIQDSKFRVKDEANRFKFRGGVVPGGAYRNGTDAIPEVNIDEDITGSIQLRTKVNGQMYTFSDWYCGPGGASLGASLAGFRIVRAIDWSQDACKTHRENHPDARLKNMSVQEYLERLERIRSKYHCDLTHISFVCKYWSPAHTRPGQNDAASIATLYSCGDILRLQKPRICTGEQTFGLLHLKHMHRFHDLLLQFTSLGYSFRWKVLNLWEYGICQKRKRLIWIASCPGEALPSMPPPTHSATSPKLPRPLTLQDVLDDVALKVDPDTRIRENADAKAQAIKRWMTYPKPRYSADKLIRTVTTCGTNNYHPSGKRNFTVRELAAIQGFPVNYRFQGASLTSNRRQIGDAVPPPVAKHLFRHIRKHLLGEDRTPQTIDGDGSEEEKGDGEPRLQDRQPRPYAIGNLRQDRVAQALDGYGYQQNNRPQLQDRRPRPYAHSNMRREQDIQTVGGHGSQQNNGPPLQDRCPRPYALRNMPGERIISQAVYFDRSREHKGSQLQYRPYRSLRRHLANRGQSQGNPINVDEVNAVNADPLAGPENVGTNLARPGYEIQGFDAMEIEDNDESDQHVNGNSRESSCTLGRQEDAFMDLIPGPDYIEITSDEEVPHGNYMEVSSDEDDEY
ncbi:S-adenosyl-L-methionine-dependent methyltransferase [Xylariomycetidae sp. FL0641]|nr:S-adenosyl-L-methionine-dependent methyltransferase [Xylariomycetidae sp. FL0641]